MERVEGEEEGGEQEEKSIIQSAPSLLLLPTEMFSARHPTPAPSRAESSRDRNRTPNKREIKKREKMKKRNESEWKEGQEKRDRRSKTGNHKVAIQRRREEEGVK